MSAYDDAIKVYKDYLPQLTAKYNNVYTQLSNELGTAQAQQTGLFGTQKTNLTNDIAKRGLTAKTGDQFFDTQQGSLASSQNVQSNDLLNKYASLRNETVANQNTETMNVNSSIAGLEKEKDSAKKAYEQWKKEFKLTKSNAKVSQAQWEKTYNYNAGQDAIKNALAAKSSGTSTSKDSQNILDAYVSNLNDAANGKFGTGNDTAKGVRERLRDQAVAAGLNKDIAQKYMDLYLPIGWEWNRN